jgi:hypothetical protein
VQVGPDSNSYDFMSMFGREVRFESLTDRMFIVKGRNYTTPMVIGVHVPYVYRLGTIHCASTE